MSVTASKLGNSPLTFDWSNIARVPTGKTPTSTSYRPDPEEFAKAWDQLKARYASREVGFYDAPVDETLAQANPSQALAQAILKEGRITACLFLGIGGSALGPICLLEALKERRNGIRFHFVENPDPVDWKLRLKELSPETTLVCSVTKSGKTFETLAQTLLALDWLGKSRWRNQFVGITDPEKGELREFCRAHDLPVLDIGPSIGGRFSIFSPVGLFPAALAGLSVDEFLLGARQVRDAVEKTPHEKNPLFVIGGALVAHGSTRPVHVCMPYSTLLKQVASWWVQLWGESLGKDGKGYTPVAAVGATDQHSIIQLLRDGPDDKVTLFISVDSVKDPVNIPAIKEPGLANGETFSLVAGHSLAYLLEAEFRATSMVLARNQRPNLTLKLDRLDERNLGALLFAFCVLTAFVGTLMEVNPFDQPGVEEGKIYIRDSLSQAAQ